jgi:CheY-like chemotaxis protein
MRAFKLLVVDDDEVWTKNICDNLRTLSLTELTGHDYARLEVEHATNQLHASRLAAGKQQWGYDLVFLDLWYPPMPDAPRAEFGVDEFEGMKWLPELRRLQPEATIIVLTSFPSEGGVKNVVDAITRGLANDFIPKVTTPFHELKARIRIAVESQQRLRMLRRLETESFFLLRASGAGLLAEDLERFTERCSSDLSRIADAVEGGKEEELRKAPAAIRDCCQTVREQYRQVANLYLPLGKQHLQRVNLGGLSRQMLLLCGWRFEQAGTEIVPPADPQDVLITTYESDVKLALLETLWSTAAILQGNSSEGGTRTVELRVEADVSGRRATITVVGNGGEPTDAALAQLLDPQDAASRRPSPRRAALRIAKQVIEGIGGSIEVNSNPGGGASVTLSMPDLAAS